MEQEYRSEVFPGPGQKCVSLPVNHTLTLCLTLAELRSLTDLLDQAAGLIAVYELLA